MSEGSSFEVIAGFLTTKSNFSEDSVSYSDVTQLPSSSDDSLSRMKTRFLALIPLCGVSQEPQDSCMEKSGYAVSDLIADLRSV